MIEGCESQAHGKGLCNLHYQADRRHSKCQVCTITDCESQAHGKGL
jgi:hypothetical protein